MINPAILAQGASQMLGGASLGVAQPAGPSDANTSHSGNVSIGGMNVPAYPFDSVSGTGIPTIARQGLGNLALIGGAALVVVVAFVLAKRK